MAERILQLSDLISRAAHTLQAYANIPDLNDPYHPASEEFRTNQDAVLATNTIVEAAFQLIACVRPPALSIFHHHIRASALRVCVESNVVEALREAGPKGMHVDDLALKLQLPAGKLGRILRYLATNHIFREIEPDVFCNNRISSVLDSMKSLKDLLLCFRPEDKHNNTNGFAALMELFGGDLHKSSAYLLENLKDPATSASEEPRHAPLQRAFKIDVPIFEWYNQSEQTPRLRHFMVAMQGTGVLQPEADLVKCTSFDWRTLSPGCLVVEVGGGLGLSCLTVAQEFPDLKFEIQDRKEVVSRGPTAWETVDPDVVERVHFRAHSYLLPQPTTNPAVFVVKHVIHNLSDPYALQVLKLLRAAAAPETRLLLVDSIIPYACPSSRDSELAFIPPPPLDNFGAVNERAYISDLTMMLNLNAQERTLPHLRTLLGAAGWKVSEVGKRDGMDNFMQPIIALPV
ncbi:O-methyltransferase [Mycena rosella]|uniref:O-methyltransferase n=1 Tax=Mycena rosella TaxID=1033263 RepID=A0AAD7G533_MYCRO|nr:O-methyltransferase [Mycena rosella]